jgi:signal transduction histidine kinase
MTAIDVSTAIVDKAPSENVHGIHLTGAWRITGISLWLLFWLASLAVYITAIILWFRWDSIPIAISASLNPEITSEIQSFMSEYQQAIRESGLTLPVYGWTFVLLRLISGIPYFLLSILIIKRRSDRLMAVLFAVILAVLGAAGRWISPNWIVLDPFSWSRYLLQPLNFLLDVSVILVYIFPDGRFVPRWTRWLALVTIVFSIGRHFLAGTLLNPDHLPWNLGEYQSQIFLLIGLIALVYRYQRDANAVQRQQIKWITAGALLLGLFYFAHFLIYRTPLYDRWAAGWSPREVFISQMILEPGWYVGQSLVAAAIGLALFRYRLWDIDAVINRVLVYGSLTLLTMAVYLAAVATLGYLFGQLADTYLFFLATGFVAILFEPLRQRLQRLVNRGMYGERDDPYAVLTRLSDALKNSSTPEANLAAITTTIGTALKIPYVSIQIYSNGVERISAVYGEVKQGYLNFPLTYQGEKIGSLFVARRSPGEEFSKADFQLIENIARQAGSTAHAVQMYVELVRSRAEIVSTREEERRRLRRDLHDGLGPILSSQTLKMAAVRQLVRQNPDRAEVLVDDMIQQNENTVTEVRRLVYGLRPPALDVLGLVDAVRDLVLQTEQTDRSASSIKIQVLGPPDGLPVLPAAVEVNAYRIALEALTNAVRHSEGQNCRILFHMEEKGQSTSSELGLLVQVSDDGAGIPAAYRAGVGMRSMRERAEELGGTLLVESVLPHGSRISAWLPLIGGR